MMQNVMENTMNLAAVAVATVGIGVIAVVASRLNKYYTFYHPV
jgi:hypothetical protein